MDTKPSRRALPRASKVSTDYSISVKRRRKESETSSTNSSKRRCQSKSNTNNSNGIHSNNEFTNQKTKQNAVDSELIDQDNDKIITNHDQLQKQLNKISKQLDQVESQLNKSVQQLLNKIDEKNNETMNLIKSLNIPQRNDKSQTSTQHVNALLIIDVQNDFINGSLSLRNCPSKHNGEEVVPVINELLDSINFDVVVYSYDWHPTNHISFFDNLHLRSHLLTKDSVPVDELQLYSTATFAINGIDRMEQKLWPRHCVQNSLGAKLHPDLKIIEENNNESISVINIYKGQNPDIDSYSAFWDNFKLNETGLHQKLKEKNVTQVFIVGLATDVCVQSTAFHAMEYGYKTFIIEDGCRGVDENDIKKKLQQFKEQNGHVIQSKQAKDYVS